MGRECRYFYVFYLFFFKATRKGCWWKWYKFPESKNKRHNTFRILYFPSKWLDFGSIPNMETEFPFVPNQKNNDCFVLNKNDVWVVLLFLCRHCCSLHMLKECPMGRSRRQEAAEVVLFWASFVVGWHMGSGVTAARGALGHSPTSRHHCFNVTATLVTLSPVRSKAFLKQLSPEDNWLLLPVFTFFLHCNPLHWPQLLFAFSDEILTDLHKNSGASSTFHTTPKNHSNQNFFTPIKNFFLMNGIKTDSFFNKALFWTFYRCFNSNFKAFLFPSSEWIFFLTLFIKINFDEFFLCINDTGFLMSIAIFGSGKIENYDKIFILLKIVLVWRNFSKFIATIILWRKPLSIMS